MPTIDKMNQEIAMWLYGSKKEFKLVHEKQKDYRGKLISYWKIIQKKKFANTTVDKFITDKHECMFHNDYNHLNKAVMKFMETDGNWFATYKRREGNWKGTGKNKKWVYTYTYSCPITTQGFGRMGYGKALNKDFEKKTIGEAMQYALYRFIKNGKEY